MSPKISITLFILKDALEFDRKHNTFHPTNYFLTLGNVEANYLKGLPHKVLFITTNVHASKENCNIQENCCYHLEEKRHERSHVKRVLWF